MTFCFLFILAPILSTNSQTTVWICPSLSFMRLTQPSLGKMKNKDKQLTEKFDFSTNSVPHIDSWTGSPAVCSVWERKDFCQCGAYQVEKPYLWTLYHSAASERRERDVKQPKSARALTSDKAAMPGVFNVKGGFRAKLDTSDSHHKYQPKLCWLANNKTESRAFTLLLLILFLWTIK